MAYSGPNAWYCNYGNGSSTGWFGVPVWPSNTAATAGLLIRQNATPTVGNERVFVCIVAGTTTNGTEPTWTVTKGAKTTDNTVTWQECTGQPGVNGDISAANCPVWTASSTPSLGFIIYDSTSTTLQICSTSGSGSGSKPTFSATAGVTTSDTSATWTSLGAASNFAGWSAPHARLANAITTNWAATGNNVFIGDNHAETQASTINITPAVGVTGQYYCVDHTASVPPGTSNLKTSATISTTGANNIQIQANNTLISIYGVTFVCGSSGAPNLELNSNGNQGSLRLDSCSLQQGTGTTGGVVFLNANGHSEYVVLNNVTVSFGNIAQSLAPQGPLIWKNTASALLGTIPTSLFTNYNGSVVQLHGIDLSAAGSGKTIFSTGTIGQTLGYNYLTNCKLGSGVTVAAQPTTGGCLRTDVVCCDGVGTNYQKQRYWWEGTLSTETVIIRTGGASNGTTSVSDKIVTQSGSTWFYPFQSIPIAIWNSLTNTNRGVTLYGIWNSASLPNNDQIWIEAEYLGSASSPMASFQTNTKANGLATGTALTADSTSIWNSLATARANTTAYTTASNPVSVSSSSLLFWCISNGTSSGSLPAGYASAVDGGSVTDGTATFRAGTRFALGVTLSSPQPQQAGPIYVTVNAALASSTFWVDPLINLS